MPAMSDCARGAGCIPLQDINDYLAPCAGSVRLTIDCVVNDDLFRSLGEPAFCYPFRPGYRWTRYYGEPYSPLNSVDQLYLNNLKRTLFPD
jgi:hypothetical protein